MHGEQAIEDLRRNKMIVREHQLNADDERFDAGDHKKQQGVENIEDAQPLVINRGHPFVKRVNPRLLVNLHAGNRDRIR